MGLWQLVIQGTVAITELTTVCLQMMSNVQCTLWVVIVFNFGNVTCDPSPEDTFLCEECHTR